MKNKTISASDVKLSIFDYMKKLILQYFKTMFVVLVLVISGTASVKAQLSVASTSSGSVADGTAATSLTVNHNPGSASNKVMVVAVQTKGVVTISSVTYDGDPLEQYGTTVVNSDRSQVAFYYITDPAEPVSPATTLPVVANFSSTNGGVVMGVVTFSGAYTASPFRTFKSTTGSGATATISAVETANGDIVIGAATWRDALTLLTFGTGQTERWNIRTATSGNDAITGGGSTKAITTSITTTDISFGQTSGREYAAAAFSVRPMPIANLGITKTVNNSTPYIGQSVTFTLTASNAGLGNSVNTFVNDLLPSGYTYQSHSTATGTYNGGSGVWSIGTLNSGASATLTITALVNPTGTYSNTATITGDVIDNTTTNNTATQSIIPCNAGATAPLFSN